ncbi:cytochrome P450, partial [Aureobasidium melanogenum]
MFFIYLIPIIFIVYYLYTRLTSPLSKLPGPFYTNLTPLYLIYQEFSGNRRTYIDSLHTQYGPVIRISPSECSFSSYEAMKQIYTSGGVDERERDADGEQVHLHCFALDGASQHLFAPYGTNSLSDPEDFKIMQEMSYADSLRAPYLEYYAPRLAEFFDNLNSKRSRSVPLANDFVLEAVQKPNPASYSLLSKLQSKAEDLEDLSAAAECMDHLAAGIDTTGDGLCFLMHELSLPQNAHIQQRLRDEINSNQDESFDQLPYLDAVVKEGLRVFPPIPMSFPRYTPDSGTTLDGYYIPGHTIVSCQPFTLHKDPDVFPSPEKFNPQRWLEEKGELERNRMFFAFSQGARGCIGKHLALAEMKILLREVYGGYKTLLGKEEADMRFDDQVISSRPKGQKCRLQFQKVG